MYGFLDFLRGLLDPHSQNQEQTDRLGEAPIDRERRRWQSQLIAGAALVILVATILFMVFSGHYPSWQQMRNFIESPEADWLRNFTSPKL